ncbi:hotdog family protein [Flavitalea flava]
MNNSANTDSFIRLMRHPFKFRMYLLARLPSAFFSGLKIREMDTAHCITSVPYKWFSQNPFRSTYFACLSMAAEMSTGALAMTWVHKLDPPVSMLVIKLEANYFKKATGLTSFQCNDGLAIRSAIEKALTSGEGQTFRARSVGTNEAGEEVAEFFLTWSFKAKKQK